MRSNSKPGSVPFFGPDDWRNRSKLNGMNISELLSNLRDTFLKSDFDIVEETLVAREATLKAEIEEKKREIRLLNEKFELEKLAKLSFESELKRIKEKVKNEKCEFAVAEMERENVRVLVEEKRRGGDVCKEDGRRVSEQRLGKVTVIDINEDECNLPTTLHRKENPSCVIANTEHQSSSGVVKKNLETRLDKPIGITPSDNVDQVDDTLVAKEATLKAVIEEKVREIGLLQEMNQFKSLGRLNFEVEVKMVRVESRSKEFIKVGEKGLADGKAGKAGVGHERTKFDVLKNGGFDDGESCAVADLEGQKVKVSAKKERFAGAPGKKDGLGCSDTKRQGSSRTVQENLVTRLAKPIGIPTGEAMLKEAIEEKIRLLHEKNQFKKWGRLNFGVELKMGNGERCVDELGKIGQNRTGCDLDDGKEAEAELGREGCKREALKNSVVGDGEKDGIGSSCIAEEKRLAGELSKKGGLGSSGNKQESSLAVPKNLATKLVEPNGILKRDFSSSLGFVANMNILNGLDDSDDSFSDSSSSSGEFDMDIPPLISLKSNKKMKTNQANL